MTRLTLRPARSEDREAVTALCAHIWEGEDYIPDVFDDWVGDETGSFMLLFADDTLVGLDKLTELSPDEWWLEGLRVHPDHRGQGLARYLHEAALSLAERRGQGTLRFSTASKNRPVHALATNTGFRAVADFHVARAAATLRPAVTEPNAGHFSPATPAALPEVRAWLARSAHLAAVGGLMEEQWSWMALLPRLEELLAAERIAWWESDGKSHAGLVVFSQGNDEGETRFWVNYADVPPKQWTNFWRDLRHLAATRGATSLRAKPPALPAISAALAASGWEIEPDYTMWVYARSLPEGERAQPDSILTGGYDMNPDDENEIIAETDAYFVWRSDEEGEFVYHLELGGVTLHMTSEEWEELIELMKSVP